MKMNFKVLAAAAAMTLSLSANAGFLIEPYLGYGMGSAANEETDGTKGKADTTGMHVGARLGLTFTALFVAADYSMIMSGKLKDDTADYDYSGNKLGLTVGMGLPMIRLWAGYGLQDNITVKDDAGNKVDVSGSNIKVGFGFDIFPMVDLNLEYIMSTYNKIEPGDFDATYNSYTINTTLLSLSVPF